MKTAMIWGAGLVVLTCVPATAQDLQHRALQRADQAHSAAAQLAAATLPHAECGPGWNRVARQAVAADNAAAAVMAALSACDFCAARDAADALDDIADDLRDDLDDLEPVAAPVPRRFARQEMRQLEELASILEDVSSDLRRDTRRLDKAQEMGGGMVPPPYVMGPLPPGSPVIGPSYRPNRFRGPGPGMYPAAPRTEIYAPGSNSPRGYETPQPYSIEPVPQSPQPIPQRSSPSTGGSVPRSNYGPPMTNDRTPVPSRPIAGDSLGPSLSEPPSGAFGPVPDEIPAAPVPLAPIPAKPVPSGPRLDGNVSPTAGSEPQVEAPELSGQPKPAGRLQTIPQRPKTNGPALLPPAADAGAGNITR